jgi:hypothetical protein
VKVKGKDGQVAKAVINQEGGSRIRLSDSPLIPRKASKYLCDGGKNGGIIAKPMDPFLRSLEDVHRELESEQSLVAALLKELLIRQLYSYTAA